MFMNNDLASEIRSKVDIVDIIGERIPLVAKGKNFFGVCPFHEDTNPSMSVSREKQIYRCFSCGASGNVFTFLMNYDHKEFREVLKDLGERVGINTSSIKVANKTTKYDNLYEAYSFSYKYFQNNLLSQKGRAAREYLKNRGINDDIIKEFQVGLSLIDSRDLTLLLTSKNYDLKTLNQIGLSSDGHDVYKNRIMFPLHDPYGKIVGFSGRIYEDIDKDKNKYLNTKETVIFKKGSCLYHYHIAKDAARVEKRLIIMEGFMDVIRASTIGIRSTVALMGTALTEEQISLIKRLSKNIIICLDGDGPGRHAALKVGEHLQSEGIEARVVTIPGDDDPDSYILKYGKDSFYGLLDRAREYNDYKIEVLKENVNFQSEESLAKYINSVLEETAKIKDEIRVEIILKKLAKDYNIGYNTLEKRFQEFKTLKPKATEIKVRKIEKSKRKDKYNMAMEQIIYLMLNNDWVIDQVENENLIYPRNEERLLTSEIIYFYKKYGYINVADFYTYIQDKPDLLRLLNDIVSSKYLDSIEKKDLFPYFRVVKEYSIEMQKKRMEEKMKLEDDPMRQAQIAKEIVRLKLGE